MDLIGAVYAVCRRIHEKIWEYQGDIMGVFCGDKDKVVGGLEHFLFSHISVIIIPID